MPSQYRQKDAERVENQYNNALPHPYSASARLSDDRTSLGVRVVDPDDADLPVCNTEFQFDPLSKAMVQPSDTEVASSVLSFVDLCTAYQAAKP